MKQPGVTVLATNDDNCDLITGMTVYKPLRASPPWPSMTPYHPLCQHLELPIS